MNLNLKSAVIYGDVLIICLHPSTLRIPAISMRQICHQTGACSAKEFFPSFPKLSYIIDTSLTAKEEFLTFPHKLTGRISECLCVCPHLAVCVQRMLSPRGLAEGLWGKIWTCPTVAELLCTQEVCHELILMLWLNGWHQLWFRQVCSVHGNQSH